MKTKKSLIQKVSDPKVVSAVLYTVTAAMTAGVVALIKWGIEFEKTI